MQCKFCEEEMEFIHCDDTGGGTKINIAYNLYSCEHCMTILRQDVWNFAGKIWIKDGEAYVEKEQ